MKKMLLLALFLGVFFPAALFAQNLSPCIIPAGMSSISSTCEDSEGGSFLSSLPLVQKLKAGKIVLNPYAQVGYQHIAANMSIPISADVGVPAGQLEIGTVDVSLQNFDFWYGNLGLNVVAGPLTSVRVLGWFFTATLPVHGHNSYFSRSPSRPADTRNVLYQLPVLGRSGGSRLYIQKRLFDSRWILVEPNRIPTG